MEAAAQGISVFAASGDDGAYDTTAALGPAFAPVLSVDSPGSDPFVVSSGGTTVPWSGHFSDGSSISVTQQRIWGWDYLTQLLADFGDQAFSTGGGGGVSSFFGAPRYQHGTPGLRVTEAGQSLLETDVQPAFDFIDLPAGFHGRNVPDISLNADPFSGYLLYYPPFEDTKGGGFSAGWGGTSFVAPQLNGIVALINQATGRIGSLNHQSYRLFAAHGYAAGSPFNDITAGNNWFYTGVAGYEPGAGIGTLDATNLATALILGN
jgi:kumamolisin